MYAARNGHPCSERVRVCRFRECGCGSACPRYALLSLMYAARVHANLHQRSRLSIIVEGGNTCQQCRTMGIPNLNCAQRRRYSLASRSPRIQQMFSNVVPPVSIQTHWKLCFYLFFLLRFLASFSCRNSSDRLRFRNRFSFSLSPRCKINAKDEISAFAVGEFNLPLRSAMSA